MTQKSLAKALSISPAYLSALERGRKGRPPFSLVQETIACFGLIWDEAEEIEKLARLSHPRPAVDTSKLSSKATELANLLAASIHRFDEETLEIIIAYIQKSLKKESLKS